MPGVEKLHLEDALDDSPQMRSLLGLFEEDVERLKKYTLTLQKCCNRVLAAQCELTAATQSLAGHLKSYEHTKFPLESDIDSILSSTLKQFANSLDEASSWHQILVSQLSDGMMFPVNKFIDVDIKEVLTLYELFQQATSDLDKALIKFSKLPKRKDFDRERMEANEEVYMAKKKFHQIALHYYSSLNALQYKRKTALIEPMLGYLHALKSHFTLGYEALGTNDVDEFLSNISASVQGVHSELNTESRNTLEIIENIEKQSQHLYHAEPTPNMPHIPPNTSLTQKSGYLYHRTKLAGVVTKWDRAYFFSQGGNLLSMAKGEVAGSLLIELDSNISAQPLENEDRRFVFQVTNGKKAVVLQALNERERDEWICCIQNIVREGGYVKGKMPSRSQSRSSQSSISKLSRDRSQGGSEGEGHSGSKTPSSSTPINVILSNTPIIFDMISPTKEDRPYPASKTLSSSSLVSGSGKETATCHEIYTVRFLGSMEVPFDRGDQLIHETIRHIMAARAIHNVFKMAESLMIVTESKLSLYDPSNQATRSEFALQDVAFWGAHHENNRLLAFITRSNEGSGNPKFSCHVFESNSSAEEICNTLHAAAKIALQQLLDKQKSDKRERETV
ncbi:DCC-interacting protein 13-alpha, variant 3 [Chamberlinius hualienensis]